MKRLRDWLDDDDPRWWKLPFIGVGLLGLVVCVLVGVVVWVATFLGASAVWDSQPVQWAYHGREMTHLAAVAFIALCIGWRWGSE
jgi:hypothetical protein